MHALRNSIFIRSGREECNYALTGEPLFETRTDMPLYGA